ncbi:DUF1493 family protein [Salmonella enterica]|uniref:DUF1493 family protein n=1 Tax=Salmonella enterica TaxID=28901 RepID=UPI001F5B6F00|nr:DUF1493 family protein [Salmonella enterica]
MVSDTLEQRIYELVRSHDGIYLFKKKELTPSTDLDSDLQLEDDEVLALMDDFFTTFNVDKGNMVVHAKWSELAITFQQPSAMAWRNAEHLSSLTGM